MEAPIKESLAAGLLLLAGYDGKAVLCDPMAGSGTLAVEAGLIARNRAPGLGRRFACERWLGSETPLWQRLRAEAEAAICPTKDLPPIFASDVDASAVAAAQSNVDRAGLGGLVRVERRAVADLEPPAAAGQLVSNLPYGVRLGEHTYPGSATAFSGVSALAPTVPVMHVKPTTAGMVPKAEKPAGAATHSGGH